mmetsp:Transcript_12971/g.41446  ORF Transcript_12971/g.41446 Transcript_12971/m.41446 type:complete len:286 (-) Transcript_12971:141-998(-)
MHSATSSNKQGLVKVARVVYVDIANVSLLDARNLVRKPKNNEMHTQNSSVPRQRDRLEFEEEVRPKVSENVLSPDEDAVKARPKKHGEEVVPVDEKAVDAEVHQETRCVHSMLEISAGVEDLELGLLVARVHCGGDQGAPEHDRDENAHRQAKGVKQVDLAQQPLGHGKAKQMQEARRRRAAPVHGLKNVVPNGEEDDGPNPVGHEAPNKDGEVEEEHRQPPSRQGLTPERHAIVRGQETARPGRVVLDGAHDAQRVRVEVQVTIPEFTRVDVPEQDDHFHQDRR